MRKFYIALVSLSLFFGSQPGFLVASPVPRDVLALFDSTDEEIVADSNLHRLVEFPLNHMGLRVSYWDVSNGMPDWTEVAPDFVVSWFRVPVADPVALLGWMREARDRGTPIVTIGVTGMPLKREDVDPNDVFEIHGLSSDSFVPVTFNAEIKHLDRSIVGYECAPDVVLPAFPNLKPLREDVVSFLTVRSSLTGASADSVLVSVSDAGGVIASGYALCQLPESDQVQWLIDPFAFFLRAFDLQSWPVPDTTTLSGRRLYFSHIDGDGWNNVSEVSLPSSERPFASEVINERILRDYPEMPVGVGLIAGDVDPELGAPPDAARIARDTFALPNVEIAVHGYSHPFIWSDFEEYDRQAELEIISEKLRNTGAGPLKSLSQGILGEDDPAKLPLSSYFGLHLSRAYVQRPFSLDEEVEGAIEVANSLAPDGKTAQAFYWTGDTRPFPAAVAAVAATGLRNLNGGDGRFDSDYPSIAYLSPLGRMVGAHRQVYTANANEVIYTDGWTRDFHALSLVAETAKRTSTPLRLKPFNLYYHTFVAEKFAGLESLFYLYEIAASDEFIRVFPTRYIDTVNGFFSAEITNTGENEWRISNRGDLQTLRIDQSNALAVDFLASSGIIGQHWVNDALYVSLDPNVPEPLLKLEVNPEPVPHLVQASWEVTQFVVDGCNIEVTATGFGVGDLRIADIDQQSVQVVASRDGVVILNEIQRVEDGRLNVRISKAVGETTKLDILCLQ